jgi:CAAX protease family protein
MTTGQVMREEKLSDANEQPHRSSMKSLVIYLVFFFIVWSLRATVLFRLDESIASPSWRNVYSNAVKFVVWVIPVFLILVFVDKVRPLHYLKLTSAINWRGALLTALIMSIFLAIVVLVESSVQGKPVATLLGRPSYRWFGVFAGVFSSPMWEEILFRGFVLNRLNERLAFWQSNAISAFLFMLAHVPYWVSHGGLSQNVIKDLVNVFVLGALFGWFMKKSNSLWPPVLAHTANNFVSGLIHS